MAKIENTGQVLTEQQFNSSLYKSFMSYKDYLSYALKFGSAFTIARAMVLVDAKETSNDIKESVQGWYLEKEAKKDIAEEEYYAALAQYEAMKTGQYKALKDLQYATNQYTENSTYYTDALKKYDLSTKTLFSADVNLSIARDKFNFANNSAFKAYLTSRLT